MGPEARQWSQASSPKSNQSHSASYQQANYIFTLDLVQSNLPEPPTTCNLIKGPDVIYIDYVNHLTLINLSLSNTQIRFIRDNLPRTKLW